MTNQPETKHNKNTSKNTNDIFGTEAMHELQFMKSVSQFLESTSDDITNSWDENDAIINCYNQIFKVVEEFSTDMKLRALDTWKY